MSKIKLCIVSTVMSTMNAFIIPSAKYLNKKGFDVSIMCDMNQEFYEVNSNDFNCINVKMERNVSVMNSIKAIYQMYKVFKNESYDMVQYCTPNAALYASVAAFLARVPIRVYCQWGIRYVGFSGIKRFIFKSIEKLICILSTQIRPASNKNMEFAINEKLSKPSKYKVLGKGGTIGVDLSKYNEDIKIDYRDNYRQSLGITGKVVFGYIGSIRKDKGSNELLKAFRDLSSKYDDVALMLIGDLFKDDSIDKELLQWSKQCENIVYCGHIKNVNKYMSAIDIVVHPSYREGFSMVAQEASAMGLPVITTNIPGASEAVLDGVTGVLVEKASYTALYNAMENLKNNPSKCSMLGENGRKMVEENFERNNMLNNIYIDRLNIFLKSRVN
ncbi:MAG: glycosyltransferase family 4 protein [Peptostreptococcaceae bacterium]